MQARFGEFVFDAETRELRRGGEPVHLSPKAFLLLGALLESRPKALAKTVLSERLWPDTFVVEANLANLVAELRAALGEDSRHPRYVRTVHRFGYAFREAEEPSTPAPRSRATARRLTWKGGRTTLAQGEHVLGRDPDLELSFDSPSVSRRHARLRVSPAEVVLEDLGSKNGTWVNGRRVGGPVPLADRDEIRLGNTVRLTFREVGPAASTETAGSRDERG
ncbi:MAG TPA: FHA domain-containing protein [Vicinamibacteria bacterium]